MESEIKLRDFFSKVDGSTRQRQGGKPGLSALSDRSSGDLTTGFDNIVSQEGAEHLKPVIQAIYKQESGGGANGRTSINGARGGMQIMPGTFRRYAKPGESIDNPDDNMRVGVRIIKDLGSKFGNDPAKIATGYFSGEGNVNHREHGSAWKNDHADGNGKRVSGYVSDILSKIGMVSEAHAEQPAATNKPDLDKAPAWADVATKPEFINLAPEDKEKAKQAYFDYYIRPHAGKRSDAILAKFMKLPDTPRDRTWGEALSDTGVQLAEGVNTIGGAIPNLVAPEGETAAFFNRNAEFWRDKQSDPIKAKIANADRAISAADEDGVIAQIAEASNQYFNDPELAARFITTNLPSMIPGIGAAKLAQAAALAKGASAAKAGAVATTAAGVTGAALNAGGARGEAFEDIKNTLIKQGMSPEKAEETALSDSRISAAVGGIAGFISGKTGLEKSLFAQGAGKGAIKAGVKGAGAELLGEQLEEVAPKLTTNYLAGEYDDRSLGQDVGRTIVETGIASSPGAAISGGVAAFDAASGQQQNPRTGAETEQPGTADNTMDTPEPAVDTQPVNPDANEHPTTQAANAIVRDLARTAGIPEEALVSRAQQPVQQPDQQEDLDEPSDDDVLNFADSRHRQLREKRDGHIQTGLGDSGIIDQDIEGEGLTQAEQQELSAIEQSRGDVSGLRRLYGLDKAIETPAANPAPRKEPSQRQQAEPDLSNRGSEELRQQFSNAKDRGIRSSIADELQRREAGNNDATQSGNAQEDPATPDIPKQPEASIDTSPDIEQVAQEKKLPKPKTEREAKQQRDLDEPQWWKNKTTAERHSVLKAAGIKGTAKTSWGKLTPEQRADLNAQWGERPANEPKPKPAKEARARRAEQEKVKPVPAATQAADVSIKPEILNTLEKRVDETPEIEHEKAIPEQKAKDTSIGAQITRAKARLLETRRKVKSRAFRTEKERDTLLKKEHDIEEELRVLRRRVFDENDEPAALAEPGVAEAVQAQPVEQKPKTEKQARARRAKITKENNDGTQTTETKQTETPGTEKEQAAVVEPIEQKPDTAKESGEFSNNKIFTTDKVAAARARLKSKLGTLNSGIDPEILQDGITLAGAYIESGIRTYSAYSKAMINDLGEQIRPYLRSFYESARHYPGLDTTGMTTSAEIDLMEKQATAAHTKPVEGASDAVGEVVKHKRTKERKPGDLTLVDNYGVSNIDGYDNETGEGASGAVKSKFLKDTKKYLVAVQGALGTKGFEAAKDKKGKPIAPVSINESGIATSGEVRLAMFHPEKQHGIYVHITGTALRGIVPTTKSGVSILMRVTKGGDQYDPYGGDQNRWLPVSMTASELADYAAHEIEKISILDDKKQALEKKSTTAQDIISNDKEIDRANPIQTESISAGNPGQTENNAATGNGDSQPVDARVAENSKKPDSVERVSGSTEDTGRAGAASTDSAGVGSPVELGESERDGVESKPTGTEPTTGRVEDHTIDADEIGKGGLTKKYRDNVAAIKILKTIEAESRVATPAERKAIAKYAGWGAMKGPFDPANKAWAKQHAEIKELLTDAEFKAARASTRNAHFTSPVAVESMYSALQRLGVTGGRILEPSVGVGNFFGLMPKDLRNASQLHGVELDSLTSRLVAALYPKAKIAKNIGFENFEIPSEYFDVVIGNPPFGNEPLVDKERSAYSGFSIHNYFLAKSIDKLRPGGVMAVVVSHNFLDAQDGRVRKWIGDRASLVGAVRLPDTAFKENAGTEVVTDILIFQKHDITGLPGSVAPWQDVVDQVNINPKTGEAVTHKVNQFFVTNPDAVLGKPSAGGTMYAANQYTVTPDGDIKEGLSKWVSGLPQNIFSNVDRASDAAVVDMAIPEGIKVGSYFVDAAGKVMRRGDDVMGNRTAEAWKPRTESQVGRMKGMIAIRDALRTQMRLERSVDSTEQEIEANRANLNAVYDDFVKKYKHINSVTNRGIFLDDTEGHLIQGLEFDYDKGIGKTTAEREGIEPKEPSAVKADIFDRRVAFPQQDYLTVTTAKDALLASLNYRGKVDPGYMTEVYGKPFEEITKELGDVVFDDPQSGVVTADEYLSGDVKTKLAEAEAAAQDDPRYRRNVEALKPVIPKDKTPSEISVSIGAAFVPAEMYQQFIKHITGGSAVVSYIKAVGTWSVSHDGTADQALNTGKFGTSELSAKALFDLTMLGKGAVVKKTIRNADGSTSTILLEKETEAAKEKQNAIKAEWNKWLWQDPERADKIASIYNDKMNRIVNRRFDGSHMTSPGMTPATLLLAHQKNGVWRGLQTYQVLYDQVVGAGKTFLMATLAMEMRRLGIARKPLFVVPNHLTLQWLKEFTRLYPGSNVLAATPDDFSKDNRERLFAKIITGDWDAVIIGHSSLKKIGLPEETETSVLNEQIEELSASIEEMKRARGDSRIISDMERIRKNIEAKMKEKLAAVGQRSKMVTFDELGVDAMFVDEMHEFKNLAYHTTMDRNPGMGNPNGSAKAFDMFVKTRWLFDTFGDKTPFITATGTPVSNSLVEMYNMQRYMQYPTLKREGLHIFDAWAKQFGNVENVYEVAPSGAGYRQSTRFAKFTNLPALMSLYNQFADTITLDDLKAQEIAQGKRFPVPAIQGGRPTLVVAKRSPAVSEFMGVPMAQRDDNGNIEFEANLANEVTIQHDAKSDKWNVSIGNDVHIGMLETEQDAKLEVVKMALTPVVSVDPESILGRFANLRNLTRETKGKVNALSLTGAANKAGLDYRLIDPTAPDFAGSKINLAVDNMVRVYHQWTPDKGAQLVFCDLSIPLSARASLSSKARSLYIRSDDGTSITRARGTLHTSPGHEDLPYFVIQRGTKDKKQFEVYDAAAGFRINHGLSSKAAAIESTNALLNDEKEIEKWLVKRDASGEIEQAEIDEYNSENDIETVDLSLFITREDIAGVSGSAKFSVYDDIKAKLVAKGIPAREVAFIHDYSTPVAKDKLFKAVNAGDVRFLLGSTPKMGAGTNVQERLVGLHHIDAPWRPSDLEQREGRIIRRGNKLYERDPDGFEVFIGRYATEQTYDTRRWQILEHKARGIEQLRKYDGTLNEIDDIDGEAANAADMKAAASGDPLILKETKLRNDVRRLEQVQAGHADEVLAMTRKARESKFYAEETGPRGIAETKELISTTNQFPLDKEGFAPVIAQGGRPKTTKETAHEALTQTFNQVRQHITDREEIKYRGLTFHFEHFAGSVVLRTPTGNGGVWTQTDAFSPSGMVQRMKNYIDRLPAVLDDINHRIEKAKKDIVSLQEQAKQPFQQAGDLEKAREEHKMVQRALMAKGPEVPESQKAEVAEGIEQQKAKLRELGYGDALDELISGSTVDSIKFQNNDGNDHERDGIKKNPSESDARNIRELNLRVTEFLQREGREIDHNLQPYVAGSVRGDEALRLIERAFGARVQWFALKPGLTDAQKRTWGFFNGANLRGVNFLRSTGNDRPHLAILGHELVHQLKRDNPELYSGFVDAVRQYINFPEYRSGFLKSNVAKDADDPMEEFMAEVGSDAFMERGFWEKIGKKNPNLLSRLVDLVAKLVDTIKAKIGYNSRTARYLHDYEKVIDIATDVMGKYIANQGNVLQNESGNASTDTKFSRLGDFSESTQKAQNNLFNFFGKKKQNKSPQNFGTYHTTLSTQYHKALIDPHYGEVFKYANAMQNEVSLASIRPAELAPGILPRVDDVKLAVRGLFKGKENSKHLKKVANAVFAGTLEGGTVYTGKVWNEAELKDKFGLDETGVKLYQQARASIDASLDELAAAEAFAMAQNVLPKDMRRTIIDSPDLAAVLITTELDKQIRLLKTAIRNAKLRGNEEQQAQLESMLDDYKDTINKVDKIFTTSTRLKKAGYAPLMRFGKWTVTAQVINTTTGAVVRDEDGNPETVYFGKFETEGEAMAKQASLKDEFKDRDDISITAGVDSKDSHELFAGVSPETIALFGDAIGAGTVTEKYYKIALSERSSLKRKLERKGTPGFNDDLSRVLSNFITSNARFAAQRYYLRDLNDSIKSIPKEKGDVKDEAIQLKQFIIDPSDPAAPLSTVMFAWFLGGSVAAAAINLSQPFMMTGPYLSQFGVAKATAELSKAMPIAMGMKEITNPDLRIALKRASREGVVDAQEIFHLYSLGAQSVATGLIGALSRIPVAQRAIKAGGDGARARVNAFLTLWGSMFSMAEKFNRKLTFVAAYNMAPEGTDPYAFAVRAVNETQGIYNKANRPNWARTPVGRTIFTFKQFSLMYVELLSRMWKRGGPEGKRAALIMLAVLALAAGEEGLPFVQDLDDLIDTIGQLFGLDTNMRRSKREMAYAILSKELGDLFLYGASSQMPLDVSGRLGLGNFIPGTALLKKSDEQMRVRNAIELLGPAAGMGAQLGDAYDAAAEGNSGKALQNLAPKAIKDLMAAEEMARKGYASDAKGRKVVDTGLSDAAIKATGFNPTKIANVHRKTMPLQQDISLHRITEASIANQWARGVKDSDNEMVADAQKRQENWNRKNPDMPIAINGNQIRDRVRALATDKDSRILKNSPKEIRGRIGLDLME